MRDREREAETQAEGEAGSMQEAQRGTPYQVSRTKPWAKGRRCTAEPPRDPSFLFLKYFISILFIYSSHTHTEAETQAEGEAGSMPVSYTHLRAHET